MDEQHHVVGTISAADGLTIPPPVPDVLDSQAQIESGIGWRVIAVAEPAGDRRPDADARPVVVADASREGLPELGLLSAGAMAA